MTDVVRVDDPSDPRLRDYLDLTDVELRRRREPADGLFMAEGEKVIRRALAAGYQHAVTAARGQVARVAGATWSTRSTVRCTSPRVPFSRR